jgi:hypothetical protein
MKATQITLSVTVLIVCLLAYCVAVVLMFRKDRSGLRRRWHPMDYIWVPLGGLTVMSLLALWWHMR